MLDIRTQSRTRRNDSRAGRFPLLPDGLLARKAARVAGSVPDGPGMGSMFSVGAVSGTSDTFGGVDIVLYI